MRRRSTERQVTNAQSRAPLQMEYLLAPTRNLLSLTAMKALIFDLDGTLVDTFFDGFAFPARNQPDYLKLTWLRTIVLGCPWLV